MDERALGDLLMILIDVITLETGQGGNSASLKQKAQIQLIMIVVNDNRAA